MDMKLTSALASYRRRIGTVLALATLFFVGAVKAQLLPTFDAPPNGRFWMGSKSSFTVRQFDGERFLALTYTQIRAQPNSKSTILGDLPRWRLIYAQPTSTPGWFKVTGRGNRIYPDLFIGQGEGVVDVRNDGRLAVPEDLVDRDDYYPLTGYVQGSHLAPMERPSEPHLAETTALPSLWKRLGVEERRFLPKNTQQHPFSALAILHFNPLQSQKEQGSSATEELPITCSAFFFGKPDYLLTAGHCVGEGSIKIEVPHRDGLNEFIPATVSRFEFRAATTNGIISAVRSDWAIVRLSRLPKQPVEPILLAHPRVFNQQGVVKALTLGFAADLAVVKERVAGTSELPQGDFCEFPSPMLRVEGEKEQDLVVLSDASLCIMTNGDSGGPLLVWNPERKRYELLAIASWSDAGKNISGTDKAREVVAQIRSEIEANWGSGPIPAGFAAVQRKIGFFTGSYLKHMRFLLNGNLVESLMQLGLISHGAEEYFNALKVNPGGVFYKNAIEKWWVSIEIHDLWLMDLRYQLFLAPMVVSTPTGLQFQASIGDKLDLVELQLQKVPFRTFAPVGMGVKLESVFPPEVVGDGKTLQRKTIEGGDVFTHLFEIVVLGGDAFLVERSTHIVFDVVRQVLTNFQKDQEEVTTRHRLYPRHLEARFDSPKESPATASVDTSNKTRQEDAVKSSLSTGGAESTVALKKDDVSSLTPLSLPGGSVIKSVEAWRLVRAGWLNKQPAPVVLSAINDELGGDVMIPTAIGMGFAGTSSSFTDEIQARLAARMLQIAPNKEAQIIVYCLHEGCWLSYNLGLRLVKLGYKNTHWMREGIVGWIKAMLPLEKIDVFASGKSASRPYMNLQLEQE